MSDHPVRRRPDFSATHAVLQRAVDGQLLAGVSVAVLRDGEPVDAFCTGHADREAGVPLTPEHIHRAYSNTKLVVSAAVLKLIDQGQLALDAPVAEWLPRFGALQVLKAGARSLGDTEPMRRPITIRLLLSHQQASRMGCSTPARCCSKPTGKPACASRTRRWRSSWRWWPACR